MITALAIPVLFLLTRGQSVAATARLEEALAYYVPYFLCTSLVFPLVFLLTASIRVRALTPAATKWSW